MQSYLKSLIGSVSASKKQKPTEHKKDDLDRFLREPRIEKLLRRIRTLRKEDSNEPRG